MPKKHHGPYGPWCYVALRHIIAKPETWVNILSEISPGKLCKVSESVPGPEKEYNRSPNNREVSERRQQVKNLQKRITELEYGAVPAGQPKAAETI